MVGRRDRSTTLLPWRRRNRSRRPPFIASDCTAGRRRPPKRVTHSLRDMNSKIVTVYWLLAVAQWGDSRHAPLQERLWDDHK
jgi:hypothetical protein